MNNLRRVLFVLVVLALLLSAAYQPALGQAGTIKIGAIVPLTGPVGPSGQAMQKGYALAVEEINRNPPLGRRVELIVEDDRGDPPTAAAAFLKLVTRDRVDAVIGGLQSATSIAVGAQARQHPILMAWIGAAAVDFERLLADADWFFHYHPWTYNNAESTWAFIRSTGARTAAVAAEDGPFGESSLVDGAPFARAHGINTVLIERFRTGTPDLTPLLTKAKGANADVFVFVGFDQDVIPLVTQARQVGLAPKLILAAPPGWPVGYDKLPAGNNVAGMALWTNENGHPASRAFVRAYRERFKEDPTFYWAPLAYTNLITVGDAIRRARSTELNALVAAMKATDYEGPIGIRLTFKRSSYGKNQGFTRLIAFQWQNGRQVPVWP
ncbi:MAG TPA: ABC transporter substrate-binding protein, partial [bacterium]|nr:ABC transporter substrate-binding protein [bacterium]